MEGLPGRREHLAIFFDGYAPLEDGQQFPQEPPGKADSNISTPGLRPAYGQVNNLAPHDAKIRATDSMR